MCDQTMANNKMDVFDVFPRVDVIQGVVLIMPCWYVQKLSHCVVSVGITMSHCVVSVGITMSHCVSGNHRSYIYIYHSSACTYI